MSRIKDTNKIELSKQLQMIELEKKLLKGIHSYYDSVGKFDHKVGVSLLEFKNYLLDHGFEDLRQSFLKNLSQKIDEREQELNNLKKQIAKQKSKTEDIETEEYLKARMKVFEASRLSEGSLEGATDAFGILKHIVFIPSWSRLIESEFKGFYLNQPVYEIIHDNVLLLPDFAVTGIEETKGEPFIFLNGVGVYYTQFRLTPGEIIDDYREITGIVLPLDVYEKAQDISTSMVSSKELLMTEYMISLPFAMLLSPQTKQMYIRGVVARNVVHPYQECFNKLLDICQNSNSLKEDEGMKVLCGGLNRAIPLYTNEILTEDYLSDYSRLTAGVKNIQPKLDKIITNLQIQGLKKPIFRNIKAIKQDYINKGWPRLLDWMP